MADGPAEYAARALRAHAAMDRTFRQRRGLLYRHDGLLRPPGSTAHLWPFARALVARLDLAGMPAQLRGDFDADRAVADDLAALERYWDTAGDACAYASDIVRARVGGDRYYDDNAWVGLALVELERLRPGSGMLGRAAELLAFAVAGWDRRAGVPSPGGVFWVEQGRGLGLRNHDRNTVSNAPNAQLGLHIAELRGTAESAPARLRGAPEPPGEPGIGPRAMYEWVNATLDAAGADAPGTGLFWDKIRGDGSIDRMFWSYNQGSMIGLNVLLHRNGGERWPLERAEAIARRALSHYAGTIDDQPPAFNAIFFRNLLILHGATAEPELRGAIHAALRGYADRVWAQRRDRHDRVRFARRPRLLDQSAIVQVLALLAWDPADYDKLA